MRNNKGFAITTMLYGLSIMGILTVAVLMGIMANTRVNTKGLIKEIEDNLNRHSSNSAIFTNSGSFETKQNGWYRMEVIINPS